MFVHRSSAAVQGDDDRLMLGLILHSPVCFNAVNFITRVQSDKKQLYLLT